MYYKEWLCNRAFAGNQYSKFALNELTDDEILLIYVKAKWTIENKTIADGMEELSRELKSMYTKGKYEST